MKRPDFAHSPRLGRLLLRDPGDAPTTPAQEVCLNNSRQAHWLQNLAIAVLLLALAGFQTWFLLNALDTAAMAALLDDVSAGNLLMALGQCLAFAVPLLLCWRLYLVLMYKPDASVSDAELPPLTVIVPAFNEGRQVYATLLSLINSDYPRDRLQIIAVNDGSADDTWHWMQRGAVEHSDRIIALNCRVNRGKRAALYEGFTRAKGDVIVTVDSDSEVLRDTLRNLVSPMVRDERVGAVAGNVRVLNENQGALPAMLDVMFTFSFEFIRAGESRLDTVTCCPGALAAYRRDVVDVVKDEWLEQTFMGQPANIGEDRALTNLILKQGYLSRYQSNAIVLTEVPNNTRQLSKMLLRWARSNVRETLAMASFAFTKFRKSSALGARVMLVLALWRLALTPFAFAALILAVVTTPQILPWVVLVTMLTALPQAVLYACWRGSARALWAFPYSAYNLLCLSWIAPYAFFTPHHSGWLTRQTPKPVAAAPRVIPEPARRMLATADQLRPSRLSLVPDVRLPQVSSLDANS